jgi:hypothetical protein
VYIYAEEVYIDYGSRYDRDDYVDANYLENQKKLTDEFESLLAEARRIRPVTMDGAEVDGSSLTDQDTTIKGGFLDKLKKQEKDSLDKSGILRPDEAAKTFAEFGTGMFLGNEDKELIESLTGKPMVPLKEQPNRGKGKVSGDKPVFSDLDDDKSSSRGLINDDGKVVWEDKLSESASMFGDLSKPTPRSAIKAVENSPVAPTNVNKPKQTFLTPEESMNIANRLDSMSEAELQVMADKMKSILEDALSNQLKDGIKNNIGKGFGKTSKSLPPTKPKNPEVREKYDSELKEMEAELEKIYQNPGNILQEILENPDKYIDDEMIKEFEKKK